MFNKKRENARVVRVFGGGGLKASLYKVFGLLKSDKSVRSTLKTCSPDNLVTRLPVNCGERDGLIFHNVLSSYRPIALTPKKVAFTMAEILLSLTIIGVVAAITLPSLTGNINERTWNTQRKALHSRLSQAIALMPSIRGYGSFSHTSSYVPNDWGGGSNKNITTNNNGAEAFLTNGLGKVMKLNNICDYQHMGDCGLPNAITRLGGAGKIELTQISSLSGLNSRFLQPDGGTSGLNGMPPFDSKAAAFETANGESIIAYYNPYCTSYKEEASRNHYEIGALKLTCVNFIYDLNGKKGPNTIGKDMGFMAVMGATDSDVVSPMPHSKDLAGSSLSAATQACRAMEDSRLPTAQEIAAMAVNRKLLDENFMTVDYWTSSKAQNGQPIFMEAQYGRLYNLAQGSGWAGFVARCIKRN